MCWWTSEEARGRKVAHRYCLRSPAVACRVACRVLCVACRMLHVACRVSRGRWPTPLPATHIHTDTEEDKRCERDHTQVAHTNHLQLSYLKSLRLNTVMRNALGGDQNLKKIHRSTTEKSSPARVEDT